MPLKIFLSSTTDDLEEVRNRFRKVFRRRRKDKIRLVCYEDDHGRYPGWKAQRTCIRLVAECKAMILLLDKRYGGDGYYLNRSISITHAELRRARRCGLRIVPIIQRQTWHEFLIWQKNKGLRQKIKYARVHELKLFDLIKEVHTLNCELWGDFSDDRVAMIFDKMSKPALAIAGQTTLAEGEE